MPGPWFQGDIFERKLGGECILYDPRPWQSFRVFVGGISPNDEPPKLFMSLDYGATFYPVFNNFLTGDTITCITMHKNRNEIYIGTTSGIYKSQGFNGDVPKPFYKLDIPVSIQEEKGRYRLEIRICAVKGFGAWRSGGFLALNFLRRTEL